MDDLILDGGSGLVATFTHTFSGSASQLDFSSSAVEATHKVLGWGDNVSSVQIPEAGTVRLYGTFVAGNKVSVIVTKADVPQITSGLEIT